MSRIVQVQITDTEKGTSQARRFVIRNRGQLVAAIDTWLSSIAEPALDKETLPDDMEEV